MQINKRKILIFSIILLIGIINFHPYFNNHYSIDCYKDIYLDNQIFLSSAGGRPIAFIILYILNSININLIFHQQILWILVILIFSFSTYLLFNKLSKLIKNISLFQSIILSIILSSLIFNIFLTEVFSFNTSLIFQAIAYLFVVLAINEYDNNINRKSYIKILLLLSLSLFSYQSFISYFVVITLIITIIFFKNIKKQLLLILSFYLIPIIINFIYLAFIHKALWPNIDPSGRIGLDLIGNGLEIIRYQKQLWIYSLNMMPPLFFLLLTLLPILFAIIFKKYLSNINKILLILIITIPLSLILGLILHVFTNDIWLSQRSTLIIASIPSLLILIVFLNVNNIDVYKYLILLSLFILIVQSFFTIKIGYGILENNRLEQIEAKYIEERIKDYESYNNEKIKYIYFANDINPKQNYDGIIQSLDVNVRGLTRSWTFIHLLKFIGLEDIEYINMSIEERNNMFGRINTDNYSDSNFIFISDKLYILIY